VELFTSGEIVFTCDPAEQTVVCCSIRDIDSAFENVDVIKVLGRGVFQIGDQALRVYGVDKNFDFEIFGTALEGLERAVWRGFEDPPQFVTIEKTPEFRTAADITREYLAKTAGEFSKCAERLDRLLEEFQQKHDAGINELDRVLALHRERSDKFSPYPE
jgi:hypothetical protein